MKKALAICLVLCIAMSIAVASITSSKVIFFKNREVTNSYTGTWSGPFHLLLGMFTGSIVESVTDITDITYDWFLVRTKYASQEQL